LLDSAINNLIVKDPTTP